MKILKLHVHGIGHFVVQAGSAINSTCLLQAFKLMGAGESTMVSAAVKQSVDQLIKTNKVMIFSKTYCPYCTMAKKVRLYCLNKQWK